MVENRLSLDGHVIDHAKDIATADEHTATTEYDLILLDIMLPDGDGVISSLARKQTLKRQ